MGLYQSSFSYKRKRYYPFLVTGSTVTKLGHGRFVIGNIVYLTVDEPSAITPKARSLLDADELTSAVAAEVSGTLY